MYRQSAAGEDHFIRALLVGNVATVALCARNEEALVTVNRLLPRAPSPSSTSPNSAGAPNGTIAAPTAASKH